MQFKDLGLLNELLRAIGDEGYDTPTPIQEQAIPLILKGHDLMAGSQTGTGKTAGFILPLLQRLISSGSKGKAIWGLILTPTRELAAQLGENIKIYGKYLPLKTSVIYGGVSMVNQIKSLRKGVDIVIATPGRLLDHISQNTINLSQVEIFVLDEADRMLDMGFLPDIRRLFTLLPSNKQNLLFSATFSDPIKQLASTLLKNPKTIEVARHNSPAELVSQVIHPVDNKRKRELLSHLISTNDWKQVLVFTRTKHGANRLSEQLVTDGIRSVAIHGNKTQAARTKALQNFKQGHVRVLVATDIAARGIDIDQLSHVVNFEIPNVPEDYVHRIGRTGRAGNRGDAISLVCVDEHKYLSDIERLLKQKIPTVLVPGYEPDPSIKPQPIIRKGSRPFRGPKKRNDGHPSSSKIFFQKGAKKKSNPNSRIKK